MTKVGDCEDFSRENTMNMFYELDFFSPMNHASKNWHEQDIIYGFLTNADASFLRRSAMGADYSATVQHEQSLFCTDTGEYGVCDESVLNGFYDRNNWHLREPSVCDDVQRTYDANHHSVPLRENAIREYYDNKKDF